MAGNQVNWPLIIFHSPCRDGLTAAWVARLHFVNRAEFLPANYGDAAPDVTGRDVYILDFAYPRQTLLDMKAKAKSILVLDHHKSTEADLAGLDFCKFDMFRSGAGMTWDHFFPKPEKTYWYNGELHHRPWLINYIEDRDLWNWKLLDSKAVSAGIDSFPATFEAIDYMPALPFVLERGQAVMSYQDQIVDRSVATAREVDFNGFKVLAANTQSMISEVGSKLAEGRLFGVTWYQDERGWFKYSLRSTKGDDKSVDVSMVAKVYGGGGHKTAAGIYTERALF